LLPEGIEPIIIRLKAGHPDRWTTGAIGIANWRLRNAALKTNFSACASSFGMWQSAFGNPNTHGWIRTTSGAINNRGLYQLSYVGFTRKSQIGNRNLSHG
jgi:hypothetical protein